MKASDEMNIQIETIMAVFAGCYSVRMVSTALGVSTGCARQRLDTLARKGLVEMFEDMWMVTHDGMVAADLW